MANRIYPSGGVKFNTPLGYDGSDFRALKEDKTGNTDASLRTSFPNDRNQTTQYVGCSVYVAQHNWTTRATYTVPSGKKALMMMALLSIGNVPATSTAEMAIQINGYTYFQNRAISTTLLDALAKTWPCAVYLIAGDVITILSYNGSTTSISFVGSILLSEFNG